MPLACKGFRVDEPSPVQDPELLAMAKGSETSLFLSRPGREGRERTCLCRFQAKQRQQLINGKEVTKHSGPKRGWGWGREAPRTRLYGQSIPMSQAVGLQLPPAWNPRCLRQENGSNRMERSNYSSSGGCWGWVGSSWLGALGPQLAGPGVVAGGEGSGGRPGAGLRCPGAVD